MTIFTPDWKLTINAVEYTNVAISDIAHQAGREDIYSQPNPSYMQIELVALNNENYNFIKINQTDLYIGKLVAALTIETESIIIHRAKIMKIYDNKFEV